MPPRSRAALLVAALAVAAGTLPGAVAQTLSYIYTGQTGAQTQIDIAHTTTWNINVAGGTTLLMGGAKVTMKRGLATTATATFACYAGTTATGTPLASKTLQPSDFTGSYQQITFAFSPQLTLQPGSYICTMTSTAPDVQSKAYFIKGELGQC